MLKNDLLLRAARRERTERTPVWLMRQAGRFDPQYRAIRDQAGLPLEDLFRDADLAARISLLPKRIGVDAIIIYQDILTPLAPMGARFVFRPGPVLDSPLRTACDVERLRPIDPADTLGFVASTLRLVRRSMSGDLPVLGFAGAPLTLAFFLVEGRSPGRKPARIQAMMRSNPASLHRLLDRLADMTADYLSMQIDAGADAVQLFESVADLISIEEYREFAHPYHVRIFSKLAGKAPRILYVKEQPHLEEMVRSGADVLSVGTCVGLAGARRRYGHRVAFQGNVDHRLLAFGSGQVVEAAATACVAAGEHEGHIVNLSHGLLKETPFDNVCRFVAACKKPSSNMHPATADCSRNY